MREMLKRIILVIFILLVLTAVSGFFYIQQHPLEGNSPAGKVLNISGHQAKE